MTEADLLQRFHDEVISTGSESTIPCNLSDEWLYLLSKQADEIANENDNSEMSLILLAIIHILQEKNASKKVAIDEELFLDYINQYRMELGIEDLSRRTEFKGTPATIKTIFTNRDVSFTKQSI